MRQLFRFLLLAVLILVLALLAHRIFGASDTYAVGNRSEFTAQGCIGYNPTHGDVHRTVFIDPGHGGPDSGANGVNGSEEKNLTLAVALNLLPLLRAQGFHVVLSRTADVATSRAGPGALSGGAYTVGGEHADIQARIDCANAARANLLLSIHFDAYSDPSVGGVETTYDPDRPFHHANHRFASLVQQAVLSALQAHGWTVPDRGVTPDTAIGTPAITAEGASYGHLMELGPPAKGWLAHPSQMPGALAEPLFITDPGEEAVAVSKEGQRVLAKAFDSAIVRYFSGPGR